jgi:hypothetical protein
MFSTKLPLSLAFVLGTMTTASAVPPPQQARQPAGSAAFAHAMGMQKRARHSTDPAFDVFDSSTGTMWGPIRT